MRKFKHKLTGDVVTEVLENGDLAKYKTEHGFIAKKFVENSNDWEELIELPIGIKILNTETQNTIEKKENGWFKIGELTSYTDEDISKGILKRRFKVVEEKLERNFQILSFIANKDICPTPSYVSITKGTIVYLQNNGKFESQEKNKSTISSTKKAFLENQDWSIYSVKKISEDGEEIFTLGDKTNIGEIKDFQLFNKEKRIIVSFKQQPYKSTPPAFLDAKGIEIKKLSPLFKTHDGVDIFEGDTVYGVYHNFSHVFNTTHLQKAKIENWLKFSTEEKAEEYIMWNKPCLSLNDVASIYPGVNKDHSNMPSHQAERLKELVKSKLS